MSKSLFKMSEKSDSLIFWEWLALSLTLFLTACFPLLILFNRSCHSLQKEQRKQFAHGHSLKKNNRSDSLLEKSESHFRSFAPKKQAIRTKNQIPKPFVDLRVIKRVTTRSRVQIAHSYCILYRYKYIYIFFWGGGGWPSRDMVLLKLENKQNAYTLCNEFCQFYNDYFSLCLTNLFSSLNEEPLDTSFF